MAQRRRRQKTNSLLGELFLVILRGFIGAAFAKGKRR